MPSFVRPATAVRFGNRLWTGALSAPSMLGRARRVAVACLAVWLATNGPVGDYSQAMHASGALAAAEFADKDTVATPVVPEVKPSEIVRIWPGVAPGDEGRDFPPERASAKPEEGLIGGKTIEKIYDVTVPTLAIYRPHPSTDTGAAVVICPGGGHNFVSYDLEGTECAQLLATRGMTGLVLKYRVPFRDPQHKARAAVQDAQRAMSFTRAHAEQWKLKADRIGILGFSAGGEVAGRTALAKDRLYPASDKIDEVPFRPDFAMLVYPAYLADVEGRGLVSDVAVDATAPPMFIVHTFNDPVTPLSSLYLWEALKKAGVNSDLHIYDRGGHAYGVRQVGSAISTWPRAAFGWLEDRELIRVQP